MCRHVFTSPIFMFALIMFSYFASIRKNKEGFYICLTKCNVKASWIENREVVSPIDKKYLPTKEDKRKGGVFKRFAKNRWLGLIKSGSIAVPSLLAWGVWIEII